MGNNGYITCKQTLNDLLCFLRKGNMENINKITINWEGLLQIMFKFWVLVSLCYRIQESLQFSAAVSALHLRQDQWDAELLDAHLPDGFLPRAHRVNMAATQPARMRSRVSLHLSLTVTLHLYLISLFLKLQYSAKYSLQFIKRWHCLFQIQECIPVGCVPSSAVAVWWGVCPRWGVCLSTGGGVCP